MLIATIALVVIDIFIIIT